jgi:hypothetical protein
MTMSIELEYQIQPNEELNVAEEVAKETAEVLEKLTTDEKSRKWAREQGVDVDEFDRQVQMLKDMDPTKSAVVLIEVKGQGQGIDPGTLAVIAIIIPPLLEHYVAPVAVNVTTSIWEKLILPRLERKYPKVVRKGKHQRSK